MPSKKGIDQALTWLKGKANDKSNSLDSINAELCMNVIMDLQRQYDRLGAQFNNVKNARFKGSDPEIDEEQLTFLDKSMNVKTNDDYISHIDISQPKPNKPQTQHPRTTNIPLNRKGDVRNETTGTETTGVRDRKPDR